MDAVNIFVSLIIFLLLVGLMWWIIQAVCTFLELSAKWVLAVRIIAAVCLLLFLVAWFQGEGPHYFKIIR